MNKNTTYLFYDTETTGLNPCFDQILQFAAIRTDLKLNILNTYELKIKLRPDVIFSPEAIIKNKISIQDSKLGICEFEAIEKIHKILNEPNTISLGYNSIKFDNEFLRFGFYRNLLEPYIHENKNNCNKMDVFPITVVYSLFHKNIINFPKLSESRNQITLKLESINKENNFIKPDLSNNYMSHNAMFDVKVLIGLTSRLIKETKTWDYLAQSFIDKEKDKNRFSDSTQQASILFDKLKIGFIIGLEFKERITPAVFIGRSKSYKKQSLWLPVGTQDLQTKLLEINFENTLKNNESNIERTLGVIRKKDGDGPIILDLQYRFWENISQTSKKICDNNINYLLSIRNTGKFRQIIDFIVNYKYPKVENLDVDADLYQDGFFNDQEKNFCRQFHKADLNGKIELALSQDTRLLRVSKLAKRIIWRNYFTENSGQDLKFKFITKDFKEKMEKIENQNLIDYRNLKYISPSNAILQINNLIDSQKLSNHEKELLKELEIYIKENFIWHNQTMTI